MSPVIPQITSITSESLQSEIRRLLPSQQGFGADLQATNVIVPTIDLTAAAEGSTVPENLQTALAFGSQTSVTVNNGTATLANTAGFYQIIGAASIYFGTSVNGSVDFDLSDGLSTKEILSYNQISGTTASTIQVINVDLTIFLRAGDSCTVTASQLSEFAGSVRQIADVNGNLVNPAGFTPQ